MLCVIKNSTDKKKARGKAVEVKKGKLCSLFVSKLPVPISSFTVFFFLAPQELSHSMKFQNPFDWRNMKELMIYSCTIECDCSDSLWMSFQSKWN